MAPVRRGCLLIIDRGFRVEDAHCEASVGRTFSDVIFKKQNRDALEIEASSLIIPVGDFAWISKGFISSTFVGTPTTETLLSFTPIHNGLIVDFCLVFKWKCCASSVR
jgi:hypothetical protein